ncbi:Fur-regulated basic protein FbpA [Niallia sp. 03133]|uniref:Fur-regulated basic protein FbpA n=1 Tax=Niallia sp. 03133 TaxID=3458060 RepID=UPI004044864E
MKPKWEDSFKEVTQMVDFSNREGAQEKEQLISQLLQLEWYKSADNRQLYELTVNELETEYQLVAEQLSKN